MGPKVFSPPKPNLTKAQFLALRELKRDRDCIVLTADKGVTMVIMDRHYSASHSLCPCLLLLSSFYLVWFPTEPWDSLSGYVHPGIACLAF